MESGASRQGSPIGSHQAGFGGTDVLAAGELFKGPQYRIVEKCSSLNDDLVTQLRWISKLDDFI